MRETRAGSCGGPCSCGGNKVEKTKKEETATVQEQESTSGETEDRDYVINAPGYNEDAPVEDSGDNSENDGDTQNGNSGSGNSDSSDSNNDKNSDNDKNDKNDNSDNNDSDNSGNSDIIFDDNTDNNAGEEAMDNVEVNGDEILELF